MIAYFLVTIIHVLIFTAAFVLSGAIKQRSRSGLISFGIFVGCTVLCLASSLPSLPPSESVRQAYRFFEPLNLQIAIFLGLPGNSIYEAERIGVMRLIAFAYTYHYLNWFSKTSVIGWHMVSRPRALLIALFWFGSIGLYVFSYSVGFAVLYGASLLHVLLEFPLNAKTFGGIAVALLPQSRQKSIPDPA